MLSIIHLLASGSINDIGESCTVLMGEEKENVGDEEFGETETRGSGETH